jgi:hypothetical protein
MILVRNGGRERIRKTTPATCFEEISVPVVKIIAYPPVVPFIPFAQTHSFL